MDSTGKHMGDTADSLARLLSSRACSTVCADDTLLSYKSRQTAAATARLDTLLQGETQQIDLLRVDSLGHELSVVRSASGLFQVQRHPDGRVRRLPPAYVITEFTPRAMERLGHSPVELLDFFADHGYQICVANNRLNDIWTPTSGSAKAHQVVRRSQFQAFLQEVYSGSVTLEMSLVD